MRAVARSISNTASRGPLSTLGTFFSVFVLVPSAASPSSSASASGSASGSPPPSLSPIGEALLVAARRAAVSAAASSSLEGGMVSLAFSISIPVNQ
jgi:hypothetical protein